MSGALTKYFSQALGKQSIGDALRAGGWKVLVDGNLAYVSFNSFHEPRSIPLPSSHSTIIRPIMRVKRHATIKCMQRTTHRAWPRWWARRCWSAWKQILREKGCPSRYVTTHHHTLNAAAVSLQSPAFRLEAHYPPTPVIWLLPYYILQDVIDGWSMLTHKTGDHKIQASFHLNGTDGCMLSPMKIPQMYGCVKRICANQTPSCPLCNALIRICSLNVHQYSLW